ncbi:MAG: hypothetical protein ACRD8W_06410 [Nitrososphaeraceae archaeon]
MSLVSTASDTTLSRAGTRKIFSTKAIAKFKAIEEAREPVTDVNNIVKITKINADTHMKIVISKDVGKMIKERIASSDHSVYTSWDSIFREWLKLEEKEKEKHIDDSYEDDDEETDQANSNESNHNDTNINNDSSNNQDKDDDVFSFALFGVSMKQLRR